MYWSRIWMVAILITSTLCFVSLAGHAAEKKPSRERTQVLPELTYRQASLAMREESSFHKDSDRNYADQLYMSLKFVKTFDLVHEAVIEPAIRTKRNVPAETEVVIDQGYLRTSLSGFHLTAGKKNEYSGSGYFVNPSDLLNEDKDLFDPLYQKEGKVFTRVGWGSGNFDIGLGYIPKKHASAKEGKFWLTMAHEIAETTLNLQYTINHPDLSTLGFSAARFFGEHFEFHVDSRFQQRARQADVHDERNIFNCAVVNGANPEQGRDEDLFCLTPTAGAEDASAYSVIGSRMVLTPKRTVVLEAIQNQGGLTSDEREMYYRYVARIRERNDETEPPTRIIGRQYVFFAYQDEDTLPKTLFNIAALYNLDDQSTFTTTELRYALNRIASAGVAGTWLSGADNSEFGEFPFAQAVYFIVRARF